MIETKMQINGILQYNVWSNVVSNVKLQSLNLIGHIMLDKRKIY